jgi:hypothetical protein
MPAAAAAPTAGARVEHGSKDKGIEAAIAAYLVGAGCLLGCVYTCMLGIHSPPSIPPHGLFIWYRKGAPTRVCEGCGARAVCPSS